jgi:uncharacterized membrane protein
MQSQERQARSSPVSGQREVLLHHASMVLRASEESVAEPADRGDVQAAYDLLVALTGEMWDG